MFTSQPLAVSVVVIFVTVPVAVAMVAVPVRISVLLPITPAHSKHHTVTSQLGEGGGGGVTLSCNNPPGGYGYGLCSLSISGFLSHRSRRSHNPYRSDSCCICRTCPCSLNENPDSHPVNCPGSCPDSCPGNYPCCPDPDNHHDLGNCHGSHSFDMNLSSLFRNYRNSTLHTANMGFSGFGFLSSRSKSNC